MISHARKSVFSLVTTFIMVIIILPFVIDVFGNAGVILVGAQLMKIHTWLPTVFAYAPLALLLWVYVKATLEPSEKWGLQWKNDYVLQGVLIGVVSAIVLFLIDQANGTLEEFGALPDPAIVAAFGFIFAWGILAPFVEELLFRGIIQTIFSEKIPSEAAWHPAIFIASALEVGMHISVPIYFSGGQGIGAIITATLPQLFYVAIFGAIGGYYYHKTRSLVVPFLIHAIGNAGELILFWFFI